MSEIIYREIKNSDYTEIQEIINESFGLYKYIDNPKVLNTFLKKYLQSCLAEKTFSCIAERDKKIIGVILGNSKSDYAIFKHVKPILMTGWYSLVMELQNISTKEKTEDYKRMHKLYNELLTNSKKEFEGVLTLFAVIEGSRGLGV